MSEDNLSPEKVTSLKLTGMVALAIFIVLVLMSSALVLNFNLLEVSYLDVSINIINSLTGVKYYAGIIGITIGISALLALLYALRTTRLMAESLHSAENLEGEDQQTNQQIQRWLYQQLKWRFIGLIFGSVGVVLILTGSLYVAYIQWINQSPDLELINIQNLFDIVQYYGGMIIAALLIGIIVVVMCALRFIRKRLGDLDLSNSDISEQSSGLMGPFKILFYSDQKDLSEKLKQKELQAHLQSEIKPEDD